MRKKKIKILHVAQAAGGVDRYIRMLLKYLDKEKFENILVCSQDFNREDYDGLVDSFEQIEMNRAIGVSDLNSIKEVRRLIKKYNPDIVYAHSSKAGAIARVADIGLKNHCVYNPHGWAFNMRCSDKKRAMYTAIEKMAAPFCEKIICISDAEKQSALEKKICREDKLQVIFNGVDIEAYESGEHGTVKRSSLGIPEDAYVVGMVGRISPQKAPDVFVKMAKLVKDEIPNAHFVIVGSGNQEAEIRKYAEENKFADSLHITGWVDDPMSYVELFDVACLLSRWEGFGLALPEYMMAGKPIVASRVDAIPNIIRNAQRTVNIVLTMCSAVTAIFLPRLSYYYDNEKAVFYKLMDKGFQILCLGVVPLAVGLFLTANQAVVLLYGDSFTPTGTTIKLMCPLILIKGFGDLLCYQLAYSSKNEYILLPGSAIASIINVITNSILIPLYAQNGAVIASVMSELTTNIIQFLYLKRKIKYHISNTALVLSLFSTMVMAAVVCAIIKMNLPLAVALAMEISIGGAIYLLMNIALKNRILSEMLTKVLKKHNTGFQDS